MNQTKANKKVILLILDGWGYAPPWGGNAISIALTPNFDKLWRDNPHTLLCASGKCVGLPGHERGNSEVGHLNLGTGRIIMQDSQRIKHAIEDETFFKNEVIARAISHARKNNSSLHLMGLVSDGNIHSHFNHLFALLNYCQKERFDRVFIHGFTDGRDSEPMSALSYFSKLEDHIKKIGFGKIATVSGRYYSMDRDDHWERIRKVYEAMVLGKGLTARSATQAITQAYNNGYTDEFILPTNICDDDGSIGLIDNNDSVIFFNFRADRAREISMAFMAEKFNYFPRKDINNLFFTSMIPYGYETELKLNLQSIFKAEKTNLPLAEIISEKKLYQLHLAETEKYAHVTYFFNGGVEEPFFKEERILVPSPRVSSYAQKPEMSVRPITKELIAKIDKYNFIVINFANGDMVGHTGNFQSVVKACEVIDECLGKVVELAKAKNYVLMVTADHGNCEEMVNVRTGEPNNEHTNNPVPFILVNFPTKLRNDGLLGDVAPTILDIMNIPAPQDFKCSSLLIKK